MMISLPRLRRTGLFLRPISLSQISQNHRFILDISGTATQQSQNTLEGGLGPVILTEFHLHVGESKPTLHILRLVLQQGFITIQSFQQLGLARILRCCQVDEIFAYLDRICCTPEAI
jgi:hypothetical protein